MHISIIGNYISEFGELWQQSLLDLAADAVIGVLENAQLDPADIDAVFVSNKAGGEFAAQRHLNAWVSQQFAHRPPAMRVEGACASGALAVLAAEYALLAGQYQTVMVVGVEKMTDVSAADSTRILATAANAETEYGSTFPGLYALLAQAHMQQFGTTRQDLSAVAVKNHAQAMNTPWAQFHKRFSLEQVSQSQLVADPLRILDCSPLSDGAAAVILTTKTDRKAPRITGFGHAQDTLDLAGRASLTQLEATTKAAAAAFSKAQLTPSQIQAAEVHDCFTIAEILATEDLGFVEKGQGGVTATRRLESESFQIEGQPLVNPSGGLKACGHPVGATGVKQIAFLANKIEKKEYKNCLAHNVGGSGATAVVHVLQSPETK